MALLACCHAALQSSTERCPTHGCDRSALDVTSTAALHSIAKTALFSSRLPPSFGAYAFAPNVGLIERWRSRVPGFSILHSLASRLLNDLTLRIRLVIVPCIGPMLEVGRNVAEPDHLDTTTRAVLFGLIGWFLIHEAVTLVRVIFVRQYYSALVDDPRNWFPHFLVSTLVMAGTTAACVIAFQAGSVGVALNGLVLALTVVLFLVLSCFGWTRFPGRVFSYLSGAALCGIGFGLLAGWSLAWLGASAMGRGTFFFEHPVFTSAALAIAGFFFSFHAVAPLHPWIIRQADFVSSFYPFAVHTARGVPRRVWSPWVVPVLLLVCASLSLPAAAGRTAPNAGDKGAEVETTNGGTPLSVQIGTVCAVLIAVVLLVDAHSRDRVRRKVFAISDNEKRKMWIFALLEWPLTLAAVGLFTLGLLHIVRLPLKTAM